jgi:CBS domain-containing protein
MEYKAELLLREVVTVPPTESVLAVARLMRDKHVGCVVIAEEGKIRGVFTERDMLNKVVPDEVDTAGTPVAKYMTPDPITVEKGEDLTRVFEILSRRRFRHVPIVDNGTPVGMVSLSDFAGVLREVFEEPKYLQYFVDYCGSR